MIHQVHYPAGSWSEMFLEPYILNCDSGGVCRQAESAKSRSFPCLMSECSSVRLSPRFRQGSEIQSITISVGSGAITAAICSFGRVFMATVDDGTSMAVKATLRGFTWESPRYFAQVVTPGDCEQECQILAVLKHPNIVGLLGDLTALIC